MDQIVMRNSLTKKLLDNGFLLALLLHALLLLSLSGILLSQHEENRKSPQLYSVPAYVYQGAITPSMPQENTQPAAHTPSPATPAPMKPQQAKRTPPVEHGQLPPKVYSAEKIWGIHESILDSSREIIRANQMNRVFNRTKDADPILLIGDKNVEASPLIRLMGRALSANFRYPKMEGNFGIRGRVLVELVLHPEGYFSDVQIVESSDNANFDASALYAVNKAPTIVGARRFLSHPKTFVIGFIFD